MDVLTQYPGTDRWRRWRSILRGILAAVSEPSRCVVLYSEKPEEEREALADAARLLRRSAGGALPVVAASPRAGGRWQDELHVAGVHEIWTVERLERDGAEEVRLRVVPRSRPVPLRGEAGDAGDDGASPGDRTDGSGPPGEGMAAAGSR